MSFVWLTLEESASVCIQITNTFISEKILLIKGKVCIESTQSQINIIHMIVFVRTVGEVVKIK